MPNQALNLTAAASRGSRIQAPRAAAANELGRYTPSGKPGALRDDGQGQTDSGSTYPVPC
jgi:hypothetical protein